MSKPTRFRVVREHHGDKPYVEGDERTADAADVKHLIPHVLVPIDEPERAAKAVAPHQNKAEIAAPANKAKGK